MKNSKTLIKILAVFLLIVGCNGNEYETPESFTDLSFTTTFGSSTLREGEVNRFVSFMDLSAGATHHEWRIPKGAFFLKGPIPNNLPSHDQFIVNPGDTVSTEKTVHVLFKKGDINTVIELYNEFADSTSFIVPSYWDNVQNQTIFDTIKTNRVDDKWVATYEVTLDVYDTLVPTMEIFDLAENKLDYDAVDTIYLKFGDQLIFKDLTGLLPDNNARPTSTLFRVATIEENEDDEIRTHNFKTGYNAEDFGLGTTNVDTIKFNKTIGNFYGLLESQRERTETLRGQTARFDIPVIFKVAALDEDLTVVGEVTEESDNKITVKLSHAVQVIENSVHTNFTVSVDGTPRDVLSVLRNTQKAKELEVVLVTPLEPSDTGKTVQVTYDGLSEEIKSLDGRTLEAFTENIEVYVPTPINQTGNVESDSSNDKVLVKFDQNIDAATVTGATNAADGFTVTLNGTAATISGVTVNSTDASILELAINEGVYDNDVITVEFSGATTSEIKSIGEGTLTNFGSITVVHNLKNLLADGSFEGTFGENWQEGASGAGAVVEFSTDQARTGSQSVKLVNNKPRLETTAANLFDYEDGVTYKISYWRYIPATVDFESGLRAGNAAEKIWYRLGPGNQSIAPRWFGTVDPVKDTWEYVETEYVPGATTGGGIRFQPIPTSGTTFTYYIDDISITKFTKRP